MKLLLLSLLWLLLTQLDAQVNNENLVTEVTAEELVLHEFNFTTNFFGKNDMVWKAMFDDIFPVGLEYNFLEVGSWEGRSTVWLLQNVLTHPMSK